MIINEINNGAQKKHKKGNHVINKWWFLDVPQFPGKSVFLGVIFQNGFSPMAVQPEVPGVQKKSKDPSGGPRIIWWWRDFPRMAKFMNFKDSTIRWDRKLETRGLFRHRICFRSFLSRQNPLNRNMRQHMCFLQNIRFLGGRDLKSYFVWNPITKN